MKKKNSILFILTILALVLSACGAPGTEPVSNEQGTCTPEAMGTEYADSVIIGTGGAGGVFYPYGEGLAEILSASGMRASFTETGGSVDNMKMVQSGELQIGFSTVDSAYDAILGQAAYTESGKVPACALAVLYTSFVHVVASQASGINSVEDMKGKIISFGDSGSSTEGAANRIFEAAGLNPQTDVTRQNLSIADATASLSNGTIDAFFWIGGLPTKAVSDMLATGVEVNFIDASGYLTALTEKYGPVYSAFLLPADVYGTDADVNGIGIGNILFTNVSMSTDQAYQILKTIFGNLDQVHALHPQAANLQLQTATLGSSIPFHPGAIKFYTEEGVWK